MKTTQIKLCMDYVHDALVTKAQERCRGGDWVAAERLAVAVAANDWAQAHGVDALVTVTDVLDVENRAVGHVDYASKLALYVAERLFEKARRS